MVTHILLPRVAFTLRYDIYYLRALPGSPRIDAHTALRTHHAFSLSLDLPFCLNFRLLPRCSPRSTLYAHVYAHLPRCATYYTRAHTLLAFTCRSLTAVYLDHVTLTDLSNIRTGSVHVSRSRVWCLVTALFTRYARVLPFCLSVQTSMRTAGLRVHVYRLPVADLIFAGLVDRYICLVLVYLPLFDHAPLRLIYLDQLPLRTPPHHTFAAARFFARILRISLVTTHVLHTHGLRLRFTHLARTHRTLDYFTPTRIHTALPSLFCCVRTRGVVYTRFLVVRYARLLYALFCCTVYTAFTPHASVPRAFSFTVSPFVFCLHFRTARLRCVLLPRITAHSPLCLRTHTLPSPHGCHILRLHHAHTRTCPARTARVSRFTSTHTRYAPFTLGSVGSFYTRYARHPFTRYTAAHAAVAAPTHTVYYAFSARHTAVG